MDLRAARRRGDAEPHSRRATRAARHAALTSAQMVELLKEVDDRQKNNGDWRAQAYLEQKEKDKVDTVYETEYFRRSADQKFMILFTKPKSSAGQGYLRIDKNLWFYDPSRRQVGAADRARADRRHELAPLGLRRVAPGRGVRPHRRRGREAGRLHRAEAEADGQAGPGSRRSRSSTSGSTRRARTSSSARSTRCRAGSCARRTTRSGRRSSAPRRTATSGTRRRSAFTTRSRRRTRRW